MNNAEICYACMEGAYESYGTLIAVEALADHAEMVTDIKRRLSVFMPSVSQFYMSLKRTNAMLNRKSKVAVQAVDKMKAGDYTDVAVQRAERLLDTIQNNLTAVTYMMFFIEMYLEEEVIDVQRSMSFRELEGILND